MRPPPSSTLFPYTTLFRSDARTSWSCRAICCSTTCSCRRSRRSEEHTSELQSRRDLVCRLLLEKKKGFNLKLVKAVRQPVEFIRAQSVGGCGVWHISFAG